MAAAVTVASWNMLAESFASPHSFPSCPSQYLRWSHRANVLRNVLQQHESDILCLQEVDMHDEIEGWLEVRGYDCRFFPRPADKPDGCLTCWKRDVFALVDDSSQPCHVSFDDYAFCGGRLGGRHNIATFVLLRHVATAHLVLVVNTHLYWHPEFPDVKLLQSFLMLSTLSSLLRTLQLLQQPAVLLCGDFNSLPNDPVYKFITSGKYDYQPHISHFMTPDAKLLLHLDAFKLTRCVCLWCECVWCVVCGVWCVCVGVCVCVVCCVLCLLKKLVPRSEST